ncbi:MAG TPA: hypothetical protein VFZ25_00995 [Chloroflexota bacterium]|nr:hypothetical protein [Chloroflexota bacterium]
MLTPSASLRQAIGKYVVQSAVELAPEMTPPFLEPTVPPTGDFRIEAVGESIYQTALHSIVGRPAEYDGIEWEGIAQLVAEPDNPFDPTSVKVVIREMTVGHLPPDLARRLQASIAEIDEPVTVLCKLIGGFQRPDGTRANIRVRLDFDPTPYLAADLDRTPPARLEMTG